MLDKILNFKILLLHILVLFFLLLTFANSMVPPKRFGFLNLLSLGFPFLMGIYILLTLYWCIHGKKRFWFFLMLSFLFYVPTTRWVNYSFPKTVSEKSIKVVSFNTRNNGHGTLENTTHQEMEALNADIIFYQENYFKSKPSGNYVEYPIVGLQTKHKILNHQSLIDNGSNGHAFYADLDIDGQVIRAVNVYLEPYYMEKSMIKPSASTETNKRKLKELLWTLVPTYKIHQEQVELISKVIENSPYPVILAGDFNAVPNSWEYYTLVGGLKDAFSEAGTGTATSFHDYKVPLRIDYIMASPLLQAVSYRVHRDIQLSDHFPVSAVFNLP